ncbi:hypothetical protein D9M73_55560 [compost metagenome]
MVGVPQQMPRGQHGGGLVKAVFSNRLAEQRGELRCHVTEFNTVLGPLGAGQAGRDIAKIQLDHLRIVNLAGLGHAKQALRLEVGFKSFDLGLGAACALEVVNGFFIDREKTHGGAVLGRHVANGGAVRQGQRACAFAEKLDKLADDFFTAQLLGHTQHQIGRGHAFAQAACQLKTHHVRR